MAKKRAKPQGPPLSPQPTNPEFQDFMEFGRRIMAVPKSDIPPQVAKARQSPSDPLEMPEEDGGYEYAAL